MSRLPVSLRRTRGLLTVHPLVWFTLGVLFAGQLPGEPLHHRVWLLVLLVLAVVSGVLYEAGRRGGTFDLQDELAAGDR